ncbi:MAG: S9 family peptidase [Acidobacteria bacterium]|nr:S9 family peptidase [Acidobacteriota bacterium]
MRRKLFLTGVLVAVAAIAGATAPAAQGAKRAFAISDYYKTAFIGGPQVTDDGTLVAFTVRRFELEKGENWSEIWVMAPDGSHQRQMTFGHHHDGTPIFSPDGTKLLFVSDRSGKTPQLYVMTVNGGEPRKLTSWPLGVSHPVYSPDGKWIAVTSRVYPECGADAECNETTFKDWTGGKLKAHMATRLLYRHWTTWRDGRYSHILLVDAATGKVVRDLTPGMYDSPTFSLEGETGYAFSPDSTELCYVSNHDPHPESSTNSDLWVVPVAAAKADIKPVDITSANHGWDGSPVYSPDGRFIAYRSQQTPGYESDLFRIAVYDRQKKVSRYLTNRSTFDNWIDDIAWGPADRAIYFQAEVTGENPLFKIDPATGKITKLFGDGTIQEWHVLGNGRVIYTRRTVGEPPEIFSAAPDGTHRVRLTTFNLKLEQEVDIRPAEVMWVQGAGNYKVQVFIIKPHDFDPAKKYPLILNVHGGPQQQWTDGYRGDWQIYPGKGYVVAFANPTGSPGYGQDFVDAIRGDWGGRVFRDLMKVTDALEKLPYVDPNRMGAMGWSYGGYMMMWFEGHTTRFKAIASMMGVYDLRAMFSSTEELWFPEHDLEGKPWTSKDYSLWSPSNYVTRFKTPCQVITGEQDFRVPYTQSLEFFTDLQEMGVPSRLIVFSHACHWPSWYEMAFYYDLHLDWFHRWLGGGAAPWDPQKFLRNEVFKDQKKTR